MSNTAIANFYKSTTHDYASFFNNYEVSVRRYGEEEVFKIDDYNQFKRVFATKLQRDFERDQRIRELEEELERLKAEK